MSEGKKEVHPLMLIIVYDDYGQIIRRAQFWDAEKAEQYCKLWKEGLREGHIGKALDYGKRGLIQ